MLRFLLPHHFLLVPLENAVSTYVVLAEIKVTMRHLNYSKFVKSQNSGRWELGHSCAWTSLL